MKSIDKSKIKKYIIIFLFICLCFMITDKLVKADTLYNNDSIQFYDNSGSSVSAVTTTYTSQIQESQAVFSTTANSYGGLAVLQLSTPLIQNHIYSLYFNIHVGNNGGKSKLSSKNCIGIGNSSTGATDSYINCAITPKFSDYSGRLIEKQNGIYYTFIATSNSIFLAVPYTSEYTCYNCPNYSYGFTINDGGDTTGLTQSQVNNLINQQTTIIQNEINNMQQDISDSISENTDKEIESQKVCTFIDKSNIKTDNKFLYNNGSELRTDNSFGITDYIKISDKSEIKVVVSTGNLSEICFYNVNKEVISCVSNNTLTNNQILSVPSSSAFLRASINKTYNRPTLNICKNGNQGLNDSINDLNDSLTDTSSPDEPDFGNSLDVSSMTPITDLITMPITLYNKIISESNKSCSSYSIPFGLVSGSNYTLTFPCIDIGNYLGSNLKGIIDDLFCLFMIYEICMLGVTIFNDATSLKDSFDSLYVPRHSSDIPRHGGPVNYG